MDAFQSNMDTILPFLVSSWIILIAATLWKPQRIKNAFLLMIALFFTLFAFAGLFGNHMNTALIVLALLVLLLLLLVPILLISNGILTIRREGRSVANSLSLLLGIVIGIGELAWLIAIFNGTLNYIENDAFGVIFFIGLSIFYISCIILSFVVYNLFIQYIPRTIEFDYVIIHGCGLIDGCKVSPLLASRLDKAIEVFNKCMTKPILIPSGGRGSDETLSEAEAMSQYLLEHGIPEDKIYKEDASTTTMENLRNCKEYINSRGGSKKYRTALVSSNYHVYRCLLYAEKLDMKCIGIGSKVAWFYWPSALLREFVAIFTRPRYIIWTLLGYCLFVVLPMWSIFFAK